MNTANELSKTKARKLVYARLHEANATRFPFPIEGRIPNFVGAEAAAARLRELSVYKQARGIKVNPDSPQLPVRTMILRDGKTLYMPSPRLRGSFIVISPNDVPAGQERRAASLSHCQKYGVELDIKQLQQAVTGQMPAIAPIDLVVAGSVALTRSGQRAGKGEGYADMEYALLRELGMGPVPVVTTIHNVQLVDHMETDPHDLSVDYIVTPNEVIPSDNPREKPAAIMWNMLSEDDLTAMPVLRQLKEEKWFAQKVGDIIGPALRILFVGINPGKKSAVEGLHFAGPGNHFWRLLTDSGMTPSLFSPEQGPQLIEHGIGITNIVERASRSETDLKWDEMLAGARQLKEKVQAYRPRLLVHLGKNVYRAWAGRSRSARIDWGLQPAQVVPGIPDFVAPNPSARSTVPYDERLKHFRDAFEAAQP